MIESKTGDVLAQDVDALVNTVNCDGFMGRGIALQFKKAWPENFKLYEAACRRGEIRPGAMFVHSTGRLAGPRFIVNFPTKRHWREKSRIEDIESGLQALVEEIRARRITSIAVPPLGSGLGGLGWRDVRPKIVAALGNLPDLRVVLLEPTNDRFSPQAEVKQDVPMTPGRAALVGLMDRYLRGLLDPYVSLLEIHKLMYFMQCAGEPLRLRFVKGHYGPYAENLRNVLSKIDGVFISGFGSDGDDPEKTLEVRPGAAEAAHAFLSERTDTNRRFERVGELVEGFESPFGLELLSTVHWVTAQREERTEQDVFAAVHSWGERKRRFIHEQIVLARDRLAAQGWFAST